MGISRPRQFSLQSMLCSTDSAGPLPVFSEFNIPLKQSLLSLCLLYLFISSFCCFFHATHVIHPSSSRRCPLSGATEAFATRLCSHTFSVGLILELWEGWIVKSQMVIPRQTNRPKRAPTSMCMEVSYKCRLLGLSLLLALTVLAHMQRLHQHDCYTSKYI